MRKIKLFYFQLSLSEIGFVFTANYSGEYLKKIPLEEYREAVKEWIEKGAVVSED